MGTCGKPLTRQSPQDYARVRAAGRVLLLAGLLLAPGCRGPERASPGPVNQADPLLGEHDTRIPPQPISAAAPPPPPNVILGSHAAAATGGVRPQVTSDNYLGINGSPNPTYPSYSYPNQTYPYPTAPNPNYPNNGLARLPSVNEVRWGGMNSASTAATFASSGMTWEQARQQLRARGVTWSQLEMRDGIWHFRCLAPNPQNPTTTRQYEAQATDDMGAIRAVLERIDSRR
jgi:hypothetical protein